VVIFVTVLFAKNDGAKEDAVSRACSNRREEKIAYRILVGELEGNLPLERPGPT
jgi:hypothetical protein